MSRTSITHILLAAATLVVVSSAARAGTTPAVAPEGLDEAVEVLAETVEKEKREPWHRFTFGGSAMIVADFSTRVRIDHNESALGTELRLEDLLGLDEEARIWRIDLKYRFNRRHMLAFSYFDILRTGDRTVGGELEIGDEVFPAGATVETSLRTRITKINYWWNFAHGDDWEVGFGGGVYWMGLQIAFDGSLTTPPGVDDISVEESLKVDAPPPLFGFRGALAFTERLRLGATAEALFVPLQDYRGWIVNLRMGFEWDILDFAGVSLGYEYLHLGLEADLTKIDAKLEFTYHALLGGLYFYF